MIGIIMLYVVAVVVVWLTFWSLVPYNAWWVRGADFPRLQLFVLGVGCLVALALLDEWHSWDWAIMIALLLALAYQAKMILPYTPLYPKQVRQLADHELDNSRQIALLVSNVLTENNAYDKLITHIHAQDPDVILTLETDKAWEEALEVIEADYPYQAKVPLDNLYGMHFYSRLPISDLEIKYLISDEIPSIHTKVALPCGKLVQLHCLHPKPPSPTEAKESTLRDAELLMVGNVVRDKNHTCIVMGDLNDVAWSRTTQLFGRISGLLDPRIGRYFINTFHADYWFLRWSLDHVFHSPDFALVTMKRLDHMGSDHFPVFTVLQYDGRFEAQQEAPVEQGDDEAVALEKIDEGLDKAEEDGVATDDTLR